MRYWIPRCVSVCGEHESNVNSFSTKQTWCEEVENERDNSYVFDFSCLRRMFCVCIEASIVIQKPYREKKTPHQQVFLVVILFHSRDELEIYFICWPYDRFWFGTDFVCIRTRSNKRKMAAGVERKRGPVCGARAHTITIIIFRYRGSPVLV